MTFIFIVLTSFILGLMFVSLTGKRSMWEICGLAGILGSALFTYSMFLLYAFFDIPLSLKMNLNISYLIVILFVIWVFRFHPIALELVGTLRTFFNKLTSIQKILLVVIALIQLSTVIQNLIWPITDWDALTLYDFRARVIVDNLGYFKEPITESYYLEYPPYTSLLHVLAYNSGVQFAKIWYSYLFIFSSILFYALLSRDISKTKALIGVILFSFSPRIIEHSQMAYTNLPYAIFIGFGLIYLGIWLSYRRSSDLIIGSTLIAFSTWVRLTEPFWVISIILLFLGLFAFRNIKSLILILVSFSLILALKIPWLQFAKRMGHSNTLDGGVIHMSSGTAAAVGLSTLLSRLAHVTTYLWNNVFSDYFLYWVLLLISLFYLIKTGHYKLFVPFYVIILLVTGVLFVGTLIFSFNYPFWDQIPDSAARMSMFLSILLPYVIMRSPLLELKHKK